MEWFVLVGISLAVTLIIALPWTHAIVKMKDDPERKERENDSDFGNWY
ncbi:MAG: hypothetical protein LIO40_06010 [Ruminococcus sp.]|nr:hypothetical protein [Ruminococcus sp.]